jgi:hypothetical protein
MQAKASVEEKFLECFWHLAGMKSARSAIELIAINDALTAIPDG